MNSGYWIQSPMSWPLDHGTFDVGSLKNFINLISYVIKVDVFKKYLELFKNILILMKLFPNKL